MQNLAQMGAKHYTVGATIGRPPGGFGFWIIITLSNTVRWATEFYKNFKHYTVGTTLCGCPQWLCFFDNHNSIQRGASINAAPYD